MGSEVSVDGEADDEANDEDAVVEGYVRLVVVFFSDSVYDGVDGVSEAYDDAGGYEWV